MSPAFNMTLPCNENGIILDTNVSSNVADVLGAPITDVFVYSHGWWNDFADAMRSYNLFSVGFERELQGRSTATNFRPRGRMGSCPPILE